METCDLFEYASFSLESYNTIKVEELGPDDIFLDVDGCQVMMYHHEEKVLIVFRGTDFESLNDILVNLDFHRDMDPLLGEAYVHGGFKEELDSVWSYITKFVDTCAVPTYKNVVVTGHSLGGALALLCGARLAKRYDLLTCQVCTFGAPCVGGRTFVHELDSLHNLSIWRVRHNNDKVPNIHSLKVMGYKHVGHEVHLTHDGRVLRGPLTWRQRLWDWWLGHWEALRTFKFSDSLRDHNITKYVEILHTNLHD